jgi:hypothetical protein
MTIFVLLTMLGLGAEPSDPVEILEKAVSQVRMCSTEKPRRESWDDAHTASQELETAKGEEAPKLTIPVLLRKGRYRLETVGEAYFHEREVVILNFSPRPPEERLKPERGEDKNFAKAMNELKGSVYIDKETGRLVSVEAKAEKEFSFVAIYKKFIPIPVTFGELVVVVKPESKASWTPTLVEIKFDGYGPRKMKRRHEHHSMRFSCAN